MSIPGTEFKIKRHVCNKMDTSRPNIDNPSDDLYQEIRDLKAKVNQIIDYLERSS